MIPTEEQPVGVGIIRKNFQADDIRIPVTIKITGITDIDPCTHSVGLCHSKICSEPVQRDLTRSSKSYTWPVHRTIIVVLPVCRVERIPEVFTEFDTGFLCPKLYGEKSNQ